MDRDQRHRLPLASAHGRLTRMDEREPGSVMEKSGRKVMRGVVAP